MPSTLFDKYRKYLLALFSVIVLLGGAGLAAWLYLTRPNLTATEQGRRLAERNGCFACHGPNGGGGVFNPGRTDIMVPNWSGDLMMFARDPEQIREWISDGMSKARSASQSWKEQRKLGILKMPAFGKILSKSQIDDLVELVTTISQRNIPQDSTSLVGYERADSLGCFGCHGPGGRFSRPNPGSFKGYVASWATADFPELVKNRGEFDEWVNTGISKRMENNPFARFFLYRANLKMPAYKDHLKSGDLDALWAYISWLRQAS